MEIRILAGFGSEADVDAQIARVKATVAVLPPDRRVVIAADWRRVPIMAGRVAERALSLLTTTSERIERSGILAAADSATTLMQFFRLVREVAASEPQGRDLDRRDGELALTALERRRGAAPGGVPARAPRSLTPRLRSEGEQGRRLELARLDDDEDQVAARIDDEVRDARERLTVLVLHASVPSGRSLRSAAPEQP